MFCRQNGNYVVERRRLHDDEPILIWRNEGNRLLHKFLPKVLSDGSIVHKPSDTVSGVLFGGDLTLLLLLLFIEVVHCVVKQAVREAATICPRPLWPWPFTFWPWKWWPSQCDVGIPVPILVFLGLCWRLRPDRQTSDRPQTASSLNAPA